MTAKKTPQSLLEQELMGVGVLTEQIGRLVGDVPAAGDGSEKRGEKVDEGLKIIRKKVGGVARRLKLKSRKYYRAHKGEIKRKNRRWKKSSGGKRFMRLVKRALPRVMKLKQSGAKNKRISYSSTDSPSSNLAERIQAEARGMFESAVDQSERDLVMENYVNGAEVALGFAIRYAGLEKDDVAEQMMNVAEGLLDLADRLEEGTTESTEAQSISELGAFKGLLACAEDYFRNHVDQDDDGDE